MTKGKGVGVGVVGNREEEDVEVGVVGQNQRKGGSRVTYGGEVRIGDRNWGRT